MTESNHAAHVRAGGAVPPLRWVGGKTRLLPELLKRMPAEYGCYYEPFAGGAALFFRVAPKHGAMLSDANPDLIKFYTAVRDRIEELIEALELYPRHSAELYTTVRRNWNHSKRETWSAVDHAAAFIYLNKTCFNGLWRVNSRGEFNTPVGDYKDPKILDPDKLHAASRALQGVTLAAGGYRDATATAVEDDFVYLDPPYDPLNKTSSFTAYAAGGFGDAEQEQLASAFSALAQEGVKVMASNSDTPFIRGLYSRFRVDEVRCGRSINSVGSKRGAVNELVITSY